MLIAARKHYRTNEDYIADMDPKTGAIKLYVVKKVAEVVEDPAHEMTLAEARRIDGAAEIGTANPEHGFRVVDQGMLDQRDLFIVGHDETFLL